MKTPWLFLFGLFSFSAFAQQLTIDDFTTEATMLSAKVSPNGKYIASVWNKDDYRYVRVFDMSGDKAVPLGVMGDTIIRPFRVAWASDEKLLISLLVPVNTKKVREESKSKEDFDIDDYYMFGRIISADLTLKNTVQLLNDKRAIRRNRNLSKIHHMLPEDNDHVLMTAYRRGRLAQFKVNINTGKSEHLVSGGKRTYGYINDRDGSIRYRYDYLRIGKAVKIYRYVGDGGWDHFDTIHFHEDDKGKNRVSLEGLMGIYENQFVYRKENEETGFQELMLVDLDSEKDEKDEKDATDKPEKGRVLASFKDKDIVNVIRSGQDNDVIGYTTLDDVYRSHYFSDKKQQFYEKLAANFKDENFYVYSAANDFSLALLMVYSDTNPGAYFLYNEKTKNINLFNYPYPKLNAYQLAFSSKTKVKARDGFKFRSYILFPPNFDQSKPFPMVVLPHGGPHARDSLVWDDFAQFIATRGYIVLKPNFRGSSGFGKAFQEAGYGEWGGKMQDDIEDAVNMLVEQNLADKNRLCIVGISYGGYAALMGAIKTPDLYKCAVSINGVTDMEAQYEHFMDKAGGNEKVELFLTRSYGDPDTELARMRANSPLYNVEKITIPVLLVGSDKDDIVPYEQTEDLFHRMEDEDKPVKFITLEDSGHNPFRYQEDTKDVYKAVEEFLSKHIKPEPPK